MKFLVLSDNHGNWQNLYEIIQHFKPEVDAVFHCGDSEFDYHDPIWQSVDSHVGGNMDFDSNYPLVDTYETPVGNVTVTHGHRFNIHFGLQELERLAKETEARFVFYGHTHRLEVDWIDGVLYLNPGSISRSRGPVQESTFAMVDVSDSSLTIDYYDAQSFQLIPELTKKIPLV